MSAVAPHAPYRSGSSGVRVKRRWLFAVFAGVLVLVALGVLGLVKLAEPAPPKADCEPAEGQSCGGPPPGPPALVVGRVWKSSELGFQLEYDPIETGGFWRLAGEDARGVQLKITGTVAGRAVELALWLEGVPASDSSPDELLDKRADKFREQIPSLQADNSLAHKLLGPNVGFRDGVGGAYSGAIDSFPSPTEAVALRMMSASDGNITLVASVAATAEDERVRNYMFGLADSVLNTVRWTSSGGSTAGRPLPPSSAPGATVVGRDQRLGPTNPNAQIDFTLALRLRNRKALERYLEDVDDPSSPRYRQYIDAATFGARFGLTDQALARVERRLVAAGIRVTKRFKQRTALQVRGQAGRVSAFLRVKLADFRDREGRRYHAPLGKPVIPRDLRSAIAAVSGLSNRAVLHAAAIPKEGLKPRDTAQAYNITPLHDMGLHGEGQTVAIMSFDSFRPADVARFDQITGIEGPPVERVPVAGGTTVGENSIEVNLDIDVIRSIAPKAQILNYEAPNQISNFATALNQIVEDGRADIVSISWGICHDPDGRTAKVTSAQLKQVEQTAFPAARAQGISIFVASGDDGAYQCADHNPSDHRLTVDWPSASPDVISVGGTLLSVRQNGTYFEEAGWEDVLSGAGGGGGLNPIDDRPEWQRGPGVDNQYSNGKRQSPDVAGPADCDSAFFIVYTNVQSGQRQEGPSGCGTSAAAPFWAGIMVLVRQLAEREDAGRLGFVNPLLYELAAGEQADELFHDVTKGGNRFHNATPGWDYATGLGSPNVANLAQAMVDRLKAG